MQAPWVENIETQCREQNVAFFFKQWGGVGDKGGSLLRGQEFKAWPILPSAPGDASTVPT
jgi:protein gp37